MKPLLPILAIGLAFSAMPAQEPTATPAASPSASAEPEPTPPPGVNSAAYPLPRVGKGGGWKAAHERLVASVQKPGAEVLFVGDSITQNWGAKDMGAPVWKAQIVPLRAVNIGIAGDRAQNILWRLQNGGLGNVQPKVVVVLAGINNIGKNTAPEIVEGVTAIVEEIRKQRPETKVLLLGLLPKDAKPGTEFREKIKVVNADLAKLDDGKSVYFLDIGTAFLTPEGELTKEIAPDGLHPSTQGYEIFAAALVPKVKELLGQ